MRIKGGFGWDHLEFIHGAHGGHGIFWGIYPRSTRRTRIFYPHAQLRELIEVKEVITSYGRSGS